MTTMPAKEQRLVAVFLLSNVLFNFPLLALFNRSTAVFGIPILYAYIFLAWGCLIALLAVVVEHK